MANPDEESKETTPEDSSQKTKKWKVYSPEKYAEVFAKLVHFSSKTVNSNAAPVGVRLSMYDALDEPYVSVRTLIARGIKLPFDYLEGGAAVAGIYKQINSVIHDDIFAKESTEEERISIKNKMEDIYSTTYVTGVDFIDHRLRQILIPKKDADGSYVSMTPITAGGLCSLLFDKEQGLVSRHNAAYEEEKKISGNSDAGPGTSVTQHGLKKLSQAQFGIGGSNPQNVGGLVRTMQRPLFLDAPSIVKMVFSLYYKGPKLNFSQPGTLRESLQAYVEFRKKYHLDRSTPAPQGISPTNQKAREKEKKLLQGIADAVLSLADETREILIDYAKMLPQKTNPKTGVLHLISPELKPASLRALVEVKLRTATWPHDMAWLIMKRMEQAIYPDTDNKMLLLDPTSCATVVGILEEALR